MSDRTKAGPPVGFGVNDAPKLQSAVALVAAFRPCLERWERSEAWRHGADPAPPDPFAGLPPEVRRAVAAAAGYLAEGYEAERENKAAANKEWKEQHA